jgi:hypothetical protein
MEWRGESKLCLGDGDAGSRAKINSASLGVWGGKREKNSQPARKRPAFEVRVFPAPGRAKRTGQPHPATGVHGNDGAALLSLISLQRRAALPWRERICNAGKARGPVFLLQSRSCAAEWELLFSLPLGRHGSGFSQFSLTCWASPSSIQGITSRSAIPQIVSRPELAMSPKPR